MLVIDRIQIEVDSKGNLIDCSYDPIEKRLIKFGFELNSIIISDPLSLTYLIGDPPDGINEGKQYATSSLGGWLVNKSEFADANLKSKICRIFAVESMLFKKSNCPQY